MSREDPQLKVRLPQDLKDKITASASNLGRSINADVVARLEESFENNQSSYIEAFTDAGVKILSHVMTSLKESGLSDDQIKEIFNGFKLNKNE